MRCSQPQGLPQEARDFLTANAIVKNHCVKCNRHDGYEAEKIGSVGMFDDVPVNKYKLKDGTFATEFVQHCIWSSGPMEWFGLHLEDGREFLWPEDELKE